MRTIFAQSSGIGKAGIAVYRISGPKSLQALYKLLKAEPVIKERQIYYKKIFFGEYLIDRALIIYFKSPKSFNGEDIVEIHTHGSLAINKLLIAALSAIEGLRLAEPGEFTKIAFLNNKFDLTAAEAIKDLIEAETLMQHRQAIMQSDGGLFTIYEKWRLQLIKALALIQAYIDFPDEEIPDSSMKDVKTIIDLIHTEISNHLKDEGRGEILRNGIKLAIIGPTNAGKSSLINFLMQREIAIVSETPGTTRDIIEGHLDIGGYPVIIQDTAGLRLTNDKIEQMGINKATEAIFTANIKILLLDASIEYELESAFTQFINENTIKILNKIDLNKEINHYSEYDLAISIKDKTNLDKLIKLIEHKASQVAGLNESSGITRTRHRLELEKIIAVIDEFNFLDLVLAAEDLRMMARYIGNITGRIDVEEILSEIFENFCIGK